MNASCHRDLPPRLGSWHRGGENPQVHLAAFGKHPAWNDHIDDLGLDTAALVEVKRMIYVDGISSQIDSGAWDRLRPECLFPHFDHGFVWQRDADVVLGGLCDSRDGKGRTRYPMCVCLHAIDVPLAKVSSDFSLVLEGALNDCRQADTPARLTATLARARTTLRASIRRSMTASGENARSGPKQWVHSNLEGFLRILYQLRTQFHAWAPGAVAGCEEGRDLRSAHLRVPQFPSVSRVDWLAWLVFLRTQLAGNTPLFLMWPRSATWIDVVAGAPSAADFFRLKANSKTVPLASEIPYRMDASFRSHAMTVLKEIDAQGLPVHSIFSHSLECDASLGTFGASSSDWSCSPPQRPTFTRVVTAIAIVLIAMIAWLCLTALPWLR